ncbi:MAG: FkbM family methyltransferase [Planctomycetes bacterium]|nr:FkbM family methyltransferase [Planctomycetota bacterium]
MTLRLMFLRALTWYLRTFNFGFARWRLVSLAIGQSKLLGHRLGRKIVRTKHGFLMDLDLRDWLGQHVYATGDYEDYTGRVLGLLLSDGQTMLDIGANVGFFTLLAAQRVGPSGKVMAFEPVPVVREALIHNLQLNAIQNVSVRGEAASLAEGEAQISVGPVEHRGISSLRSTAENQSFEKITVRTVSIDTLLSHEEMASVGLIKMDIEGAEWLALQGMHRLLSTRHPDVIIEMSDTYLKEFGSSGVQVYNFITALGYRMYMISWNRLQLIERWQSDLPDQFNALYTTRTELPSEIEIG